MMGLQYHKSDKSGKVYHTSRQFEILVNCRNTVHLNLSGSSVFSMHGMRMMAVISIRCIRFSSRFLKIDK